MYDELSKKVDKYLQNRGEYDLPKSLRMEWINSIPAKDSTNDEVIIAKIEEMLAAPAGKLVFFEYFLEEYKNLVAKENKTYEEYRILDVAQTLLKEIAFIPNENDKKITEEDKNTPDDNVKEKEAEIKTNIEENGAAPAESNNVAVENDTAPVATTETVANNKPEKKSVGRAGKTKKAKTDEQATSSKKARKTSVTKTVESEAASADDVKPEKKATKAKAKAKDTEKVPAKRGRKPKANKE